MDAVASIVAIVGAALTVADKLHQTSSRLRHAPDEIIALFNEAQAVRILLQDIRNRDLNRDPWIDLSALEMVLRRAEKQLREFQSFTSKFMTSSSREELEFKRVAWYLKKEEGIRLLTELRSIRDNIVAVMSCATLSANLHISLSVTKIAQAFHESKVVEHDVLSGLAHFQAQTAASLQALEQRFSQPPLIQVGSMPGPNSRLLGAPETSTASGMSVIKSTAWEAVRPSPSSESEVPYPSFMACSTSCACKCHGQFAARSPASTDPLLGRLLVRYKGPTSIRKTCSSAKCSTHRGMMLTIQYTFPQWLLSRMLHILGSTVGDPKIVFSVPKVISQDAPVFEMARLGDILGMQMEFLERRISPTVVTEHGETLIQETIHNGFPKAARFLIQAGANPTVQNDVAVSPGQEAWDYILRRVFDEATLQEYRVIFADDGNLEERGFTIIHECVLGLRFFDSFDGVIEESIRDIDGIDSLGRTAAHWAVLRGDLEKLTVLLKLGANPDIKDFTWGNTPLDYAVRCTTADCTRVLIEYGANVNTRTTCLWTPLYGCGAYRKSKVAESHVESARLLLKNGADINARDEDGVDALMKATRQEIPLLVKFFLEEGKANVDSSDRDGVSVLAYAIRRQSHESLAILLDWGANYLATDSWNNTILHAAAAQADSLTLQVLQRYSLDGLDPDAKRHDGLTAKEVVIQREDKPKGFLAAFVQFCLDLRANRNRSRSKKKMERATYVDPHRAETTEPGDETAIESPSDDSSDMEHYEDAQE